MQLNIDTTVRTLSALVAGLPEATRPQARVLAYACIVVAFDAADALDELIAIDLDGLDAKLIARGDSPVDRERNAPLRREAYMDFSKRLKTADEAFGVLNALWMDGRTEDGEPRQSPLSRGQFTGSGMPTTQEVEALMSKYTA
jgi:hypothetical protein